MRPTHFACALAVTGLIAASIATPGPVRAGDECAGCSLLGSLSVSLLSIEPAHPKVGDRVRFRFGVTYTLPGGFDCAFNGDCALVGGGPQLTGNDRPSFADGALVVERTASEAGETTVRLDLTGQTEEQCLTLTDTGCERFFRPAFIEATTGPIEVEVQPDDTPTPTPTPTPTFTPTHGGAAGGGGCSINGTGDGAHAVILPLFVLVLVVARLGSADCRAGRRRIGALAVRKAAVPRSAVR